MQLQARYVLLRRIADLSWALMRRTTPHNSPLVLQALLAAESGTMLSPIPENEVR